MHQLDLKISPHPMNVTVATGSKRNQALCILLRASGDQEKLDRSTNTKEVWLLTQSIGKDQKRCRNGMPKSTQYTNKEG